MYASPTTYRKGGAGGRSRRSGGGFGPSPSRRHHSSPLSLHLRPLLPPCVEEDERPSPKTPIAATTAGVVAFGHHDDEDYENDPALLETSRSSSPRHSSDESREDHDDDCRDDDGRVERGGDDDELRETEEREDSVVMPRQARAAPSPNGAKLGGGHRRAASLGEGALLLTSSGGDYDDDDNDGSSSAAMALLRWQTRKAEEKARLSRESAAERRHRRIKSAGDGGIGGGYGGGGDGAAARLLTDEEETALYGGGSGGYGATSVGGVGLPLMSSRSESSGDWNAASAGAVRSPSRQSYRRSKTQPEDECDDAGCGASPRTPTRKKQENNKPESPWRTTESLHHKPIRSSGIGTSPHTHGHGHGHGGGHGSSGGGGGGGSGGDGDESNHRTRSVPVTEIQSFQIPEEEQDDDDDAVAVDRAVTQSPVYRRAAPQPNAGPARPGHPRRIKSSVLVRTTPTRQVRRPEYRRSKTTEGLPPISPMKSPGARGARSPKYVRSQSLGAEPVVAAATTPVRKRTNLEDSGSSSLKFADDAVAYRSPEGRQPHLEIFQITTPPHRVDSELSMSSMVNKSIPAVAAEPTERDHLLPPQLRREVDSNSSLGGFQRNHLHGTFSPASSAAGRRTQFLRMESSSSQVSVGGISVATDTSVVSHKTDIAKSSLFHNVTDEGKVELRLPMDNIRIVIDDDLETGKLYKFREGDGERESEAFLRYHLEYDHDDLMMDDAFFDVEGNARDLPELRYVMAVEDDLYKRVLSEIVDSSEMPCGFYYCMRDEYLGRPSVMIAAVIMVVFFGLLLGGTMVWTYD